MTEEKQPAPEEPTPKEEKEESDHDIPTLEESKEHHEETIDLTDLSPEGTPTETPPTSPVEQEGQTASSASEESKEETKETAKETKKISSVSRRKFTPATRAAISSTKGSRLMAYIILIETIFIIALMVVNVIMIMNVNKLKKTATENTTKLNRRNVECGTLQGDNTQLREQTKRLEEDRLSLHTMNTKLEKTLIQMEQERTQYLEEKLKLGQDLTVLEKQHSETIAKLDDTNQERDQLEETLTKMTEARAQLTLEYGELETKLNEVDGLYQVLKTEKAEREAIIQEKRALIAELYTDYQPQAVQILNVFDQIKEKLQTGITLKEFNRFTQQLTLFFEEFKISIDSATNELLSFKLLNHAYTAYQNSLARWQALTKLSFPKEVGDFSDKIPTLERPILSNRPWLDTIQILWQNAIWSTDTAQQVLDSHESFDPAQCSICTGKHIINCSKCDTTGICSFCGGEGREENTKGKPTCKVCEGSGTCPLCQGKKVIICPVCELFLTMPTTEK
ncbi:hypothetical protein ACFL5I_00600 [Planctomycetota bacterium]